VGEWECRDTIAEAVAIAERSDVVVLCLGLDANIEGEEGDASNIYAAGDKKDLNLPGLQQELMEKVHATGKPIILVLLSGSALAVTWADENIPSIIQGWYPGAEGGTALARMIFGQFSPSGKLPVTFYKSTEELPDFRDYSMNNRTYRYMNQEALYPFGFGLSYTKFKYSDLKLSKIVVPSGEDLECSVRVKNVGEYASEETVQLYLKDVEASVHVPNFKLSGIKKVYLDIDEEAEVSFKLTPRLMALINDDGKCILEPGSFEVYIGGSQPDIKSRKLTGNDVLKASFDIEGTSIELEY